MRPAGPGFFAAIGTCLRKYAMFQGRAPRSEFWWWALFQTFISLGFLALNMPYYSQCAVQLLNLATLPPESFSEAMVDRLADLTDVAAFLPTLAVTVRRLHDIGKSGWWVLFGLVPAAGQVMMLIWNCRHGTNGANRYGPDPLRDFYAAQNIH